MRPPANSARSCENQTVVEQHTISQARQRIVERLVGELRGEFSFRGDVTLGTDEVQGLAILIAAVERDTSEVMI